MRTPKRRAFTLIEMLVVVIIIGILAAILVPTIGIALRRSKETAMAMEMNQLTSAVEAYKLERGNDYPPDFSNQAAITSHLRRAFPRARFNVNNWMRSAAATRNPKTLDAAEALVFWLSLTKNNPRNPISGQGDPQVFYDFKQEQLTDLDNDGWPEYVPSQAKGAPYVYFDGRLHATNSTPSYAYAWAVYPAPYTVAAAPPLGLVRSAGAIPVAGSSGIGVVRPYRSSANGIAAGDTKTWPGIGGANNTQWVNPGTFQIVCAGLDNHFGYENFGTGGTTASIAYEKFPAPNYYLNNTNERDEDVDNIPNFSEGSTIGNAFP